MLTCSKGYEYDYGHGKFVVINTPGLNDTSGVKKDDENVAKIVKAAYEAGSLNAFVVVMNGTLARHTIGIRNTLERMRGTMPTVFKKNLIIVLTNCISVGRNFELDGLKPWVIKKENIFCMNNVAFSSDKETWKNDPKV